MAATRGRNNAKEKAIRSELHRRGLRFRLQWRLLRSTRRSVDIVFPSAKVAVFVDGCFWHGCPDHGTWPKINAVWWREKIETNMSRDRDTDARLRDLGWRVVRIWEHESVQGAADRIQAIIARVYISRQRLIPSGQTLVGNLATSSS